MATISLGLEGAATKLVTPKIGHIEAGEATNQRFSAALEKAGNRSEPTLQQAGAQQLDAVSRVAQSKPVSSTDPAGTATTDAQERARRALNLNAVHATQNTTAQGDLILHGLQKVRSFFSAREAQLNNLVSGSMVDTNRLFAFQMEIMNFSLVATVASKLTGTSTRTLESLLKGQ